MAMTRKELTAILSEKIFSPAQKSAVFVDMVFEVMAEALERGEKIKIHRFGLFKVLEKRARTGRNPQTGERMEISARRAVTFKPSGVLRRTLNRETI